VAKTTVVCFEFLPDISRQKLLKSAYTARNYSKNKSSMFFMDHGVVLFCCVSGIIQTFQVPFLSSD